MKDDEMFVSLVLQDKGIVNMRFDYDSEEQGQEEI